MRQPYTLALSAVNSHAGMSVPAHRLTDSYVRVYLECMQTPKQCPNCGEQIRSARKLCTDCQSMKIRQTRSARMTRGSNNGLTSRPTLGAHMRLTERRAKNGWYA